MVAILYSYTVNNGGQTVKVAKSIALTCLVAT